jgi:DNA-binding response OmpR family regulator
MRITSVDDEGDSLVILDHILGRAFPTARLESFQSPRLAFEHIQAHGTDFIVTNHGIGRMSGPDLIRVLRVHGVEVPIVMISSNPDVRSEAFEAGANNFLDKAHLEELPGVIRSHLTWEISTHCQADLSRQ